MRRLLVIAVLMLLGTHVFANKGGLRSVTGKTFARLGRIAAVPVLGAVLATVPLQYAVAQGKAEEELLEVTAHDPAAYHGAMLLRAALPAEEGEEVGREYAFHLAYIGSDGEGNSLLVGREHLSRTDVGETIAEAEMFSLYGWDGMIGDNLTVRVIDSFEDVTDGAYNVLMLEIEGLDLAADYPPLMLDDSFPYAEVRHMELLVYRRFRLREQELEEGNFTLRQLQCESTPHAMLARIDSGFTTCGINIVGKNLALGALLLHNGKLVAIQDIDAQTLPWRDELDNPLAWLATGIPPRAVDFSMTLSGALPVEAKGKLATTWGAIKIMQ